MLDIIRNKADKELEVRILTGANNPINEREVRGIMEYPQIELRQLQKSIHSKLTTIVVERVIISNRRKRK
jgi:hypothetical protein